MEAGARTPEELETLLEDAFVLHDHHALAQLFHPGAMLVAGGGLPEARGHEQIARVATQLWDSQRRYLPRSAVGGHVTTRKWPSLQVRDLLTV
jgi:hypothetical protein